MFPEPRNRHFLMHHHFIFLSCLNTSFEFSLNLLFELYYLHQNICGRYRWFPQIMDWFHDIYVSDHMVILSKCLFKVEVSRKWERCCVINFYHNFFKIKLLLEFHEIICYLIDSIITLRSFWDLWLNLHLALQANILVAHFPLMNFWRVFPFYLDVF